MLLLALFALFWHAAGEIPSQKWNVDDDSLGFVAIGDAGLDISMDSHDYHNWGIANLTAMAWQIGDVASRENISYLMFMGDNFYQYGIRSTSSWRWNTTIEHVFNAPSLDTTRFYATLGNHDYYGNFDNTTKLTDDVAVMSQINYTTSTYNTRQRWNLPWFYYDIVIDVARNGLKPFKVQIIMIDTYSIMSYGEKGCYDDGNSSAMKPNYCGGERIPKRSEQLEWLERTLQQSTADWIFAGGHVPICTVGKHGARDNVISIPHDIRRLLQKYKVDAYFSGHDHLNQVFATPSNGSDMALYSIGSSGKLYSYVEMDQHKLDEIMGKGVCKTNFVTEKTGFSKHRVYREYMEVSLMDMYGNVMYRQTQQSRRCERNPQFEGCVPK